MGHGISTARAFWPRRTRRSRGAAGTPLGRHRPAAYSWRLQRAHAGLAVLFHVHLLHRPRRQISIGLTGRICVRSAGAHLPLYADRRSAPYVRRRHRYSARRTADLRTDEGAGHRRCRAPWRRQSRHHPALSKLPLCRFHRFVRIGIFDQRRQLFYRRPEGPLQGRTDRRRP